MARKGSSRVPRTRNGGAWTEAEFKARIIASLRNVSRFWKPAQDVVKEAKKKSGKKGKFICSGCEMELPTTVTICLKNGKQKRVSNCLADHITPIVDPVSGFEGFDKWIERCFIEEGYQALCRDCHQIKTNDERVLRNGH